MLTASRPHVQWSARLLQLKNIALCHDTDHHVPIRAKARWSTEVRSVPISCSSEQTLARRSLCMNPVRHGRLGMLLG